MADPVDYYVAGILERIKGDNNGYYSDTDLLKWGYYDEPVFGDAQFIPYLENDRLRHAALKRLDDDNIINVAFDPFGPTFFTINVTGYLYDLKGEAPDSVINRTANFGHDWITSALSKLNAELKEGFDDERLGISDTSEIDGEVKWEPLPVERDQIELREAISATEEAVEAIRTDNGYAENEPDERNAILASSKGTLEALKDGTPSREQVEGGLVRPLKYLAKKFTDTAIGIAARKAVDAILSWLATLL